MVFFPQNFLGYFAESYLTNWIIGNKAAQQQVNKKENNKDSANSSMTLINDVSRINSNNYVNTTGEITSLSQFNYFSSANLSEADLFNTYFIWKKFVYFYTNQYYKIFNKEKKLGKGKYTERLNGIQKDFIKFLSRPSDKKVIP